MPVEISSHSRVDIANRISTTDRRTMRHGTTLDSVHVVREVQFISGNAPVATEYSIGRDNSGTDNLIINVPTNAQILLTINDVETMRLVANGRLGINQVTPLGQVHIDQASSTGAIPVLYLDQADVSEDMFEFNTTIGTGNAIEAIAAKTLTTTHFIKVTIPGGLTRYIPVGTIA